MKLMPGDYKLIIAILFILLMVCWSTKVKGTDFYVLATSLCEYTKANDRNSIRKTTKKAGVKLRRIYDDIKCNDMTLHAWALHNGAQEVADYYAKKVKKNL